MVNGWKGDRRSQLNYGWNLCDLSNAKINRFQKHKYLKKVLKTLLSVQKILEYYFKIK